MFLLLEIAIISNLGETISYIVALKSNLIKTVILIFRAKISNLVNEKSGDIPVFMGYLHFRSTNIQNFSSKCKSVNTC